MKKLILALVFVFATGTMVNANSSSTLNDSVVEVEEVGCARDCVDLGITVSYLLDLTVREYLVVYEACYNQNCAN
jgi:hypothetical protein